MGVSDEHSSLVANTWNLSTGFVSPQYHIVFYDLFQAMFSSGDDDALRWMPSAMNYLNIINIYTEDESDSS
jgi:hypothetical protein